MCVPKLFVTYSINFTLAIIDFQVMVASHLNFMRFPKMREVL
jgi:hypothetical protein